MKLSIASPAGFRVSDSKVAMQKNDSAKTSQGAFRINNGIHIERQFLTILFADVFNYSRLIEIDDLKTVFRLERLRSDIVRPIAESHGAEIMRIFGGDGLVISFADPVPAVRCAIELQEETRVHERSSPYDERIRFRIGMAMGSILFVNDNLHGGPVNVAARLQAMATPGEIWVGESVAKQVLGETKISFETMGRLQLRNIVQCVTAYRVVPKLAPEI